MELKGSEECIEFESAVLHVAVKPVKEFGVVLGKYGFVVVAVCYEPAESVLRGFEVDGVRQHVLFDVLVYGLEVFIKLDAPLLVVEVQHRVERVPVMGAIVGGCNVGCCVWCH